MLFVTLTWCSLQSPGLWKNMLLCWGFLNMIAVKCIYVVVLNVTIRKLRLLQPMDALMDKWLLINWWWKLLQDSKVIGQMKKSSSYNIDVLLYATPHKPPKPRFFSDYCSFKNYCWYLCAGIGEATREWEINEVFCSMPGFKIWMLPYSSRWDCDVIGSWYNGWRYAEWWKRVYAEKFLRHSLSQRKKCSLSGKTASVYPTFIRTVFVSDVSTWVPVFIIIGKCIESSREQGWK